MVERPETDVPLPQVEVWSDAPMDGCVWFALFIFVAVMLASIAGLTFAIFLHWTA